MSNTKLLVLVLAGLSVGYVGSAMGAPIYATLLACGLTGALIGALME